jgi:hypothetical protein
MHRVQGRESLHLDFFSFQRRQEICVLILSAIRRALMRSNLSALLPDYSGINVIRIREMFTIRISVVNHSWL